MPLQRKAEGISSGYIIDHVKSLCAGGPDDPGNMQWQTVSDAKVKDREERRMSRLLKHERLESLT
jgi:hypothetical protein